MSIVQSTIGSAVLAGLRPVLLSYASVVFSNSVWVGVLLMVATLSRPERGLLGVLATVTALLTARALGYRGDLIRSGYYGYNALLVALLLTPGGGVGFTIVALVMAAAVATTLLSAALGSAFLASGLPVLALPFVIVGTLVGHTVFDLEQASWFDVGLGLPWAAPEPLVEMLVRGVGSVIFEPTLAGGVLVLGAMLLWSPIAAAALVLGALIGLTLGRHLFPQDPGAVLACAYNAGLSALALGAVFFIPSRASMLVASVAALLASWLTVALASTLSPLAMPVLAWPFVGVTLLILRGLNLRSPGRTPFPAPLLAAPPERNLDYVAVVHTRLRLPGPPPFVAPFSGTWTVTQGFGGRLTHRDPWAHALDFEVLDSNRFPFRADGSRLEDYYCFGQPVLAPGYGTVVAVHEGLPDNPPGSQDTLHPWGNAIVLQHGPHLFSVLAHLKRSSVRVCVGESVVPGQPLAQCGASGRAPRPHLHLQAQATPALGAPTLEFALAGYCSFEGDGLRFHRLGLPLESETVRAPDPDPILLAFAELAPGREITLRGADGRVIRFRSETSALGEHSLVDLDRGERLYFVPHARGVTFTALAGSPAGPLGALLQAAPIVPCIREASVRFTEFLPVAFLLPRHARTCYELSKIFADPFAVRVDSELTRTEDRVRISSRITFSAFGRPLFRRSAELEIDRLGLRFLTAWNDPEQKLPRLWAERQGLRSVSKVRSEPGGEEACVTIR